MVVIILLFTANILFLKIFTVIASKIVLNSDSKPVVNKKKSIVGKLKSFLYYYYQLNVLVAGNVPSFTLRRLFYKHICGLQIGKGSKIRMNVEILYPWNIKIGDNCLIGKYCILDGRYGIVIEDNVNMSDYSAIWTMQHDVNDTDFGCSGKCGKVTIKKRSWLCFRSVILPKVTIGEGVVLATAAVAVKNCDDFGIYTGIPAKRIKDRNPGIKYNLDISQMHFG